ERDAAATRAPSAANARAQASPIPLLPPVMNMTLLSRPSFTLLLLSTVVASQCHMTFERSRRGYQRATDNSVQLSLIYPVRHHAHHQIFPFCADNPLLWRFRWLKTGKLSGRRRLPGLPALPRPSLPLPSSVSAPR